MVLCPLPGPVARPHGPGSMKCAKTTPELPGRNGDLGVFGDGRGADNRLRRSTAGALPDGHVMTQRRRRLAPYRRAARFLADRKSLYSWVRCSSAFPLAVQT